jgi:phage/plasmid-like protein (TIGR03299 family)
MATDDTQEDQPTDVAPPSSSGTLKSFTTRELPWMKIGAIEDGAQSAKEAAKKGGLDFDVELVEAGYKWKVNPGSHTSPWRTVDIRKAVVRADTGQFISFVSSKIYKPVQYSDVFAFLDEINPSYEAAGTLGNGRQGFMVVKLPKRAKLDLDLDGKDAHDVYVVVRTSHDLTRAIEVAVLMMRGKCMNALTLSSFTRDAPQRWSVKHIGQDPMAKLLEAKRTLTNTDRYMDAFTSVAQRLNEVHVDADEARRLLVRILPDRPHRDNQVESIVAAWKTSDTNQFPDTGWGLVNGVSEYFEWGRDARTRTAQSQFMGGLQGSTHKYVNRTAQLLLRRS